MIKNIATKKMTKKLLGVPKNMVLGAKNLIFRSINIPLKPIGLVFMVTDRCNSRCIHCNIWRKKPIPNPLRPEEIENFLSDKLFKNVRYVICTGGEPTVRNNLAEILLSLHKALPHARLQLSTNAILAERVIEVVNKAMQNGINLDVGVSLDGIGEDHDKIRGIPGNFDKADWLLHKLVELKKQYKSRLGVTAGIVISDLTIDTIYQVRQYVKSLDINLVEAWYNTSSFYGNYNEEDKTKIREKIIQVVKTQGHSFLQEKWLVYLAGKPIKFSCFAMNTFCVIKSNGDIVPCLNLWDAKAGNMRESSATEIWHSDKANNDRKIVKDCQGCLNSWGAGWSFESSYYPILFYNLRHPLLLANKIFSK